MQCLIWQLPRDIQRWALHEIRWNTWCRRICQRMLPWRLAAGACWRDIVWPNVTCRLSVRSFDRRDLVPTFEGALRDTETETERDGEKQRTWLCQAMRCHAPRRILSSLPPDVRRRRCLGVLGSLNYVAIFLWLCEQFNANRLFVMMLWWFMCLFTYWSIACREDAKRRCLMSLQCCHSRHWFLCLVSANAPEGWSPKKTFMNTAQALCWDETEAWGHWHQ